MFSSSLVPAVSALNLLVWSLDQVKPLLLKILGSKKVIACDLVELAPRFDQNDLGCRFASRLGWDILNSCP